MRFRSPLWAVLVLTVAVSGCSRQRADAAPLLVFAAADLRDALRDVTAAYRAVGGDSTVLVFGSTGDLATQIANGGPADLFFAANARAIDDLAAQHLLVDSTRTVYAIGRLALVARCTAASTRTTPDSAAPICPTITLAQLVNPEFKSIAIADPAHAPYGMAARQALERSGVWGRVQPKLVLGANIAQAEQFVATGNADAGIIALSLALRTPGRAYTLVDSALHEPLRQTVAVLARSTQARGASALVAYITRGPGRDVMQRYGFTAPIAARP